MPSWMRSISGEAPLCAETPDIYFNPYGENWFVRMVLADPMLSPGAKLVYNDLVYRNRSGSSFPSIGTISKDVGLGERQVQRYIKELVLACYIEVFDCFDSFNKRQTSSEYKFFSFCRIPRTSGKRNTAVVSYRKKAPGKAERPRKNSPGVISVTPPVSYPSPHEEKTIKEYFEEDADLDYLPVSRKNRDFQSGSTRLVELKKEMHRYLGAQEPPSDSDVGQVFEYYGGTEAELVDMLRSMYFNEKLVPGSRSGPRDETYSWFKTVALQRGEQKQAIREAGSPADYIPSRSLI